jgi:DNA (cytosine-5)-methyltransferase 1
MKKYKAIDLFAGIGGIRKGFEDAGFEVVYANEYDKYCCQTYRANFGEIDERDIASVKSKEIPDFDVLLAGFPCQPFSMAGERKGFEDPRGNLFFEIARILRDKKPKALFLENVKHLLTHNKGKTFEVIKNILVTELGYRIKYRIYNSKDFGLPQNRERIYIVGFKEDAEFEFPEPPKRAVKLRDYLEKNVDKKYYLSQRYYECLVRHKANHSAKGNGWGYRVLNPDGIANALVVGRMGRERNLIKDKLPEDHYKEGMDKAAKNSMGLRVLTVRECARLQGFPDNFQIPVSDNQAYKQFGNTVSIPVVKAIAREIKKVLSRKYLLNKKVKKSGYSNLSFTKFVSYMF